MPQLKQPLLEAQSPELSHQQRAGQTGTEHNTAHPRVPSSTGRQTTLRGHHSFFWPRTSHITQSQSTSSSARQSLPSSRGSATPLKWELNHSFRIKQSLSRCQKAPSERAKEKGSGATGQQDPIHGLHGQSCFNTTPYITLEKRPQSSVPR